MVTETLTRENAAGLAAHGAVIIDHARDALLPNFSRATLDDRYLQSHESYQDRFFAIADQYGGSASRTKRLYNAMSKLWFMPSTPILSNGGTDRGNKISCFLNEADDTMRSIADMFYENIWLASGGGGIGSYAGNIRGLGEKIGNRGKSSGVIPFLKIIDSLTLGVSQGCVDGRTEILTEQGWVRFDELGPQHGKVAQVDDSGNYSWTDVEEYHQYDYDGVMHHYTSKSDDDELELSQFVTPNHRMAWQGSYFGGDGIYLNTSEQLKWDDTSTGQFITFDDENELDDIQNNTALTTFVSFTNTTRTEVPFSGKVYCVSVPTGIFVARRDGIAFITGNSLRRGSAAVYLPIWHPEIEEFIELRRPTGGDPNRRCLNLHHGVVIPDSFMHAVEQGKDWHLKSPHTGKTISVVSARDLWIRLLTARLETGEPYILFEDAIRRHRPEILKILGLEVKTSNLCVAGDTKILTDKGYVKIQTLAGQDVTLWNGHEWSLSRVEKTADNARMRKIEFSNGASPFVTDEHKFYVIRNNVTVEVRAIDLQIGDQLEPWTLPNRNEIDVATVIFNGNEFKEGPTFCANEPIRHRIILDGVETGNCSEITLPTGRDHLNNMRTAVCCLASLNLETWDEWKDDPYLIEDIMFMLDSVLTEFIETTGDDYSAAKYSAYRERSVGLGVMGFHSFLIKNNIPFGSVMAKVWNKRFFKHIRSQADAASVKFAHELGPCPDAAEAGIMERFSHKLAIAPTASISIICGATSAGIEPIPANVYPHKTLSGTFTCKNKYLEKSLEEYGKNTDAVWEDITKHHGSVQHLDFLSEHDKEVFKTALEIDPRWLLEHAEDRAPFICQAQSLNLFLPADVHKRDLHHIHFSAWKKGLKSLYYCRSNSVLSAGGTRMSTSQARVDYEECLACQ